MIKEVEPKLEKVDLEDPLEYIQKLGYDLDSIIPTEIQKHYTGDEWSNEELELPTEYETIFLDYVEDLTVLNVESPQTVLRKENKILMKIEVAVHCSFDVYVYKPDWYLIEEDTELELMDPDWNQHYVLAGMQMQMRGKLELVVDRSGSETPGVVVRVVELERFSDKGEN